MVGNSIIIIAKFVFAKSKGFYHGKSYSSHPSEKRETSKKKVKNDHRS